VTLSQLKFNSMSRPKTAISPNRQEKTSYSSIRRTAGISEFSDSMLQKRDNCDLHIDLKRSQANEENLKNLLMGLNVKMTAFVDIK
jgi:hypothetical protein